VKYLNETTTVSCYGLYISSDGTLELSIQGMWTADSLHFISLLTATLKYVTTLPFTERPLDRPFPHTFCRQLPPCLLQEPRVDSLRIPYEGGSFFVTLKNLEKIYGSKFIAIKVRRICVFVILAKHRYTLQCEKLVVCVYIFIYIRIYIYTGCPRHAVRWLLVGVAALHYQG